MGGYLKNFRTSETFWAFFPNLGSFLGGFSEPWKFFEHFFRTSEISPSTINHITINH